MAVKPYHFNLKKIASGPQRLLENLLNFSPNPQSSDSWHVGVRKVLHKYLGPQVLYYLSDAESTSLHQFYNDLPDPCAVAVLGLTPLKEKAFVQIDPMLAHWVVDKLLGGEGTAQTHHDVFEFRPLTDSEQGVLEFLILELLRQIHQAGGKNPSCHFRLDTFAKHAKELQRWMAAEAPACLMTVNVTVGQQPGFIKIILPQAILSQGFLENRPGRSWGMSPETLRKKAKAVGGFRVGLWGELGETTLSAGDLKSLEAGDVMLFDETGIKSSAGGLSGEVILKVGEGEAGGFAASWEGFKSGGRCAVKELILGESYAKQKR